MYWETVLRKVLQGDVRDKDFLLSQEAAKISRPRKRSTRTTKKQDRIEICFYKLGGKHGDTYFTKREADVMLQLLKGKTIDKTAQALSLSPRTVEFYVKNMKTKVGCRTKFELVDLVLQTDFIKHLQF